MKPKIAFIVDVKNWAYFYRATTWQKMLSNEYDIDVLTLEDYENKKVPPDFFVPYDGILFFYHRAIKSTIFSKVSVPLNKVGICINNCKWKSDGSVYTYNTYFKGVKLLAACNQEIFMEFSKFHSNIYRLSQVVDENVFYYNKPSVLRNLGKTKFVMGWAGNSENPYKNVSFLQRACKEAQVQLSIQKDLPQDQLNEWYSHIDAVACVSMPIQEGGPNMVLEAGACKLPIISTPVGLIPEIVKDGVSGLIINHDRLDLFIKAIKSLVTDLHKRRILATNLHKEIMTHWTYKTRMYEIRNVLKRLIE